MPRGYPTRDVRFSSTMLSIDRLCIPAADNDVSRPHRNNGVLTRLDVLEQVLADAGRGPTMFFRIERYLDVTYNGSW